MISFIFIKWTQTNICFQFISSILSGVETAIGVYHCDTSSFNVVKPVCVRGWESIMWLNRCANKYQKNQFSINLENQRCKLRTLNRWCRQMDSRLRNSSNFNLTKNHSPNEIFVGQWKFNYKALELNHTGTWHTHTHPHPNSHTRT